MTHAHHVARACCHAPEPRSPLTHGLPRLTDKFLVPHPLACRVFGCRRPATWTDIQPNAMTIGFCDEHKTRWSTVPVHIHGREYVGWIRWPETLGHYLARVAR